MKQNKTEYNDFVLSEQAKAINERLSEIIADRIMKESKGSISIAQFIQMALYEPSLGYYQNNLHKFGEQGDFITAPEMGNFFANTIANSLSACMDSASKSGQQLSILEIGAGSGLLALKLLRALDGMSMLPNHYHILEPSASLQSQQQELFAQEIPQFFNQISWLSELPIDFEGIIIVNEVVDAIPFERIIRDGDGWYKLNVSLSNSRFVETIGERVPNNILPKKLANIENFLHGYKTEIRPLVKGWISALSNSLKSGAVILIDYGYPEEELYHDQRSAGSLTCFINHHKHDDLLQYVGIQDITAHVDFTDIALSAVKNEFSVAGFTTQAGFLLENGITELAQQYSDNRPNEDRYSISRELQQLLMPGQMGEVIKVMLLSKNSDISVSGFSMQDHLHRL